MGALLSLGLLMVLQAARADAYVYWANSNAGIGRANLDGAGVTQTLIPHSSTNNPDGVAVDGQHIYWADYGASRIGRANLDGSSPDLNWITTAGKPQGVAVDSGHVYWADVDNGAIGRANLDGTGVDQAFVDTGGGHYASGVDVDASHIYWGDPGSGTIGRANLDGTTPNTAFISGLSDGPYDVAVDSNHVYWTGYFGNNIGRANLDGTGADESFITGGALPSTVAVDSAHIYWTNNSSASNSIGRANLDGSGVNQGLINTGTNPWGIAVDGGVAVVTPTLSTTASASVTIGNSISDSATLSNGSSPGGTISFRLYAPSDTTCTGTPVFTSTKTVSGNGPYTSDNYTATAVGTYHWIATYSGDGGNSTVAGYCTTSGESVAVTKATPSLSTTASSGTSVGNSISDSAVLSGGYSPGGTITFKAYGPDDTTCSNPPAFTATKTVNGNGTYGSGDFTTAAAGIYRWIASYSGDDNNALAQGACADSGESVTVAKATPSLTRSAGPGGPVGSSIADTATLAAGYSATGEITFKAYGPDDPTCANAPAFTNTTPVSGNGPYVSPSFVATSAGTYRWVASYSGDASNEAVPGACNDPDQSVTVGKASPTLTASASPDVTLGGSLTDTAHLAAGSSPTGRITFKAYGPDDPSCANPAAFTDSPAIAGNGDYSSAEFTPTQPGVYRWVASYSGDANNSAATGACGASGQSVTVTQVVLPDQPRETDPQLQIISVALDRRAGTATLTVEANKAGQVLVAATKRVAPTDPVDVTAAKTADLEVHAQGIAKRLLHRRGKVTVNPRVLLKLPGGGQIGKRQRLQLRSDG